MFLKWSLFIPYWYFDIPVKWVSIDFQIHIISNCISPYFDNLIQCTYNTLYMLSWEIERSTSIIHHEPFTWWTRRIPKFKIFWINCKPMILMIPLLAFVGSSRHSTQSLVTTQLPNSLQIINWVISVHTPISNTPNTKPVIIHY